MLTLETFKPFKKDDLLIQSIDYYDIHKTSIIVKDEERKNDAMSYFEVIKVGDEVTEMKIGDTIILGHLQHTPPFEIEGQMYAVVSEKDVVGVLDNE